MTNREIFEKWYIATYWNFKDGNVSYDSDRLKYNHFDVDLAWNAWNASFIHYKVEKDGKNLR